MLPTGAAAQENTTTVRMLRCIAFDAGRGIRCGITTNEPNRVITGRTSQTPISSPQRIFPSSLRLSLVIARSPHRQSAGHVAVRSHGSAEPHHGVATGIFAIPQVDALALGNEGEGDHTWFRVGTTADVQHI